MNDPIIETMLTRFTHVPGVEAVVLGGSRCRGTHTPTSDYDMGIYYSPDRPLDIAALDAAAQALDDSHRSGMVTGIGGWGPWINGGGWLTIQDQRVDWLYRDLGKVETAIDQCLSGTTTMYYQPGHPQGFSPHLYLSEVALCQPVWDPHGVIAHMKSRVTPYPPGLRKAVLDNQWWEAQFAHDNAVKSAARNDVVYVAGCCFRSAMCLLQTLFALNGQYWLNEKGALKLADAFEIAPVRLRERLETVFTHLQRQPDELAAALQLLQDLIDETEPLVTRSGHPA